MSDENPPPPDFDDVPNTGTPVRFVAVSHPTSTHVAATGDTLSRSLRAEMWKAALGIIVTGIVLGLSALATFYVTMSSEMARNAEIDAQQSREIRTLQEDVDETDDGVNELGVELAGIKSSITNIERAVIRIERRGENN